MFNKRLKVDAEALSAATDNIKIWGNTAKDDSGTDYIPLLDSDGHFQIDVLSGGGAGTQYTEDAAAPADPVGGTLMLTRDDQLSTVTEVAGDWSRARGTSKGALWVAMADASGDPLTSFGGGTEYTEDVATANPQVGKAIMMERDDVLSEVTPAEGDWIGARGTAEGALWVQDFNSTEELVLSIAIWSDTTAILADTASIDTNSGTIAGDTTSIDGKITACNTGAVVISSGTVTANLGATDNAVLDTIDAVLDTINAKLVTGTVIGDVNLGATDNAVLDQIELNTDPLLVVGGGTEAAAQRVTIANDSTGVLSVDDNGGALTVDGTITANLSATDNAVLDTIDAVLDAINAKLVTGTVIGDVNLGATDNAVLDTIAGDTTSLDGKVTACNTGAVVVSSGSITADLGVNNDVIATGNVAHDAADSGSPVKTGGKVVLFNSSAPPNAAAAENDRANDIVDEYGRKYVETTHPNYWDVSADYVAAQTNASVKATPGAGLSLYLTDIIISNGATAGNITLLDGSGGTVLFEIYPAINGGCSTNLRTPIKLTANTALCITSTTVTTHSVMISGFIAP